MLACIKKRHFKGHENDYAIEKLDMSTNNIPPVSIST